MPLVYQIFMMSKVFTISTLFENKKVLEPEFWIALLIWQSLSPILVTSFHVTPPSIVLKNLKQIKVEGADTLQARSRDFPPCRTCYGHHNRSRVAECMYVPEVDALVVRVEYGRTADLHKNTDIFRGSKKEGPKVAWIRSLYIINISWQTNINREKDLFPVLSPIPLSLFLSLYSVNSRATK